MNDLQDDRWRPQRKGLGLTAVAWLFLASCSSAEESIFSAARSAVSDGRVEKSKLLGFNNTRRSFTELPPDGAILIGFELGVGKFFDIETVYALRPIYLTEAGENSYQNRGLFTDRRLAGNKVLKSKVVRRVRVQAQSGYAVGGLTIRSGLNINGLSVTFMRINGRGLDPRRAYTSEWVGDRTGGSEGSIDGKGAPVVGVFGSADEEHISALGLIYGPQPIVVASPPADPPRLERPIQRPTNPPKVEIPVEPADPPKVERPALPPADLPWKAAPPEIPPGADPGYNPEKKQVAEGMSWLPIAIFGVVAVPIFVVLLVSFGRKTQEAPPPYRGLSKVDLTKTRSADPTPNASPLVPPAASTAFCEGPNLAHLSPPVEEDIPWVLPIEPEQAPAERPSSDPFDQTPDGYELLEGNQSRVYYHISCGKPTRVSGDDFVRLECPFRPVGGTFCCRCARFVALDSVRWADTDETISAYRQRVWDSVPFWRRVYLVLFATAYEGAVNLHLDSRGRPLPRSGKPPT